MFFIEADWPVKIVPHLLLCDSWDRIQQPRGPKLDKPLRKWVVRWMFLVKPEACCALINSKANFTYTMLALD